MLSKRSQHWTWTNRNGIVSSTYYLIMPWSLRRGVCLQEVFAAGGWHWINISVSWESINFPTHIIECQSIHISWLTLCQLLTHCWFGVDQELIEKLIEYRCFVDLGSVKMSIEFWSRVDWKYWSTIKSIDKQSTSQMPVVHMIQRRDRKCSELNIFFSCSCCTLSSPVSFLAF